MLPEDSKIRKALPIWTGLICYFPSIWAEIAKVSVLGNEQHNPGEPLHWAREKSRDQMDAAFRHMIDHSAGQALDSDGAYHLGKAIWRLCAFFQIVLEEEEAAKQK
jgi:hypothetical protein